MDLSCEVVSTPSPNMIKQRLADHLLVIVGIQTRSVINI